MSATFLQIVLQSFAKFKVIRGLYVARRSCRQCKEPDHCVLSSFFETWNSAIPKTPENYCIMKLFCAVVHCVSPIFSVSLCDIHSPTSICCKLAAVLYGDCLA